MRALVLHQHGWTQRAIAEVLGVSEPAVSQWLTAARHRGPDALRSHPPPGAAPHLTADQKRLIPEFLWHGPEAYGFRGQVWTCARIAQVIEQEFGVRYHKDHVGRLLAELHWTPQVPIRRAIQRDEDAIRRWREEVWPELQRRARRERRVLIFEDESGFYLLPGLVRTYAPEAQTPVIREKQTRDHLSVMGGMTLAGKVYTLVRQESLNGLHTVEFLQHLLRVAGPRLLVIWDGSPIHRRGGQGVRDGDARSGVGGSAARLRPRSEPVGRGGLVSSEGRGDAEPGVSRSGGVASGIPPRHRPPATEAPIDPNLLCTGRVNL